jgi:hypothetical protein
MTGRSIRQRALRELRNFAILAVYLWICFGALVFLRDAVLRFQGVSYLPWGFALIKALIIAKFVMLGEMLQARQSGRHQRLLVSVARKVLFLLVLLVILTFIEEVVSALIHGEELTEAITRAAARDSLQLTAKVFIMLLILLPYVGLRSIGETLGEDRLRDLLFAPRSELPADLKPQASERRMPDLQTPA